MTDVHGHTATATIAISELSTIISNIVLGTPSNNSHWMADAGTGLGQIDVVATVDALFTGWTVTSVNYQIPAEQSRRGDVNCQRHRHLRAEQNHL